MTLVSYKSVIRRCQSQRQDEISVSLDEEKKKYQTYNHRNKNYPIQY